MYTVLIAEDEPWVLRGIAEMVGAAGPEFEVVGACSSGEEAWSLIQELCPMLLITDIMMPGLDGLSLVKRIHERREPIATVIVSGYDNFRYAQQAMSYGVSEYLLKPVEFEVLTEALARSKEKLESLRDLNEYAVKFQTLLDNRPNLPPRHLLQKQVELLQAVLRLKYTQWNARVRLLHLFDHKLQPLLDDCGIELRRPVPVHADDPTILRHFTDVLEQWVLAGAERGQASMPEAIEDSCRYIRQHFKEDLTLTDMAERTHFSVSHFSSLFKKHTGSSFVSYVNGLKIAEAKSLLRSTAYSVSAITQMIGFSTTPYFSRVFKSTVGITPLEYRKKMGS
ncbi:response regulator [Paenibacillus sp. MWE-103]|uniref:Response regulator n=1 Tax=Paenibacillus artemisiicola TaxID=1172618 RepID=A0ABS3W423_9BACL|nr:response regulator [Paenibacillus artemisiicola]MBO7743037.1 response regulator [Paenibacillus artemisiicola]